MSAKSTQKDNNMKIAIVEDDINMRKSLELFFAEQKDLEVITFRSPKDALNSLDSSFDLVITDLNMPYMNGLDFLKKGAKAAGEKIKDVNDDFKKYKMEYETYDTERLKYMYSRSSKMAEKMAIASILKERGIIQ